MATNPQLPGKKLGNYDLTFEEALLESIKIESREFDPQLKPDIEGVITWDLQKGPRSWKTAKYWTIRDRHTNKLHHHQLTIETIKRIKKHNAWVRVGKHTISLSDEDEDEIGKLFNALASIPHLTQQGGYIVINPRDRKNDRLRQILDSIAKSGRKVDLLAEILSWADNDPNVTAGLIQLAAQNPIRSKSLAAGLNYGRYSKALDEFKELVEANEEERVYQRFLEKNVWIFGSEYSELLSRNTLSRDIKLDFPLRRTVDGFLEVIEIKRPLKDDPLFRVDRSHPVSFKRNPKLTDAIDQAANYLSILDADRHQILANDKLHVDKVRAKVIIGRDFGDEKIINWLRNVNERDPRVEVLTYDQLEPVMNFTDRRRESGQSDGP